MSDLGGSLSDDAKLYVRFGLILLVLGAMFTAIFLIPDESQSGDEVAAPVDGMTSYCLPDSSGIRIFERPFPSGGTQPLFTAVYTGSLSPANPAYCSTIHGSN